MREKELEVELAKAKAAQAQAEADKARLEQQPVDASQQAVNNAQGTPAQVMKDLDDLDAKVSAAVTDIANAQNDADRASAKARLIALQKEQADLKVRAEAARAAASKAKRPNGVKISKDKISQECIDNPLAKGCD